MPTQHLILILSVSLVGGLLAFLVYRALTRMADRISRIPKPKLPRLRLPARNRVADPKAEKVEPTMAPPQAEVKAISDIAAAQLAILSRLDDMNKAEDTPAPDTLGKDLQALNTRVDQIADQLGNLGDSLAPAILKSVSSAVEDTMDKRPPADPAPLEDLRADLTQLRVEMGDALSIMSAVQDQARQGPTAKDIGDIRRAIEQMFDDLKSLRDSVATLDRPAAAPPTPDPAPADDTPDDPLPKAEVLQMVQPPAAQKPSTAEEAETTQPGDPLRARPGLATILSRPKTATTPT